MFYSYNFLVVHHVCFSLVFFLLFYIFFSLMKFRFTKWIYSSLFLFFFIWIKFVMILAFFSFRYWTLEKILKVLEGYIQVSQPHMIWSFPFKNHNGIYFSFPFSFLIKISIFTQLLFLLSNIIDSCSLFLTFFLFIWMKSF